MELFIDWLGNYADSSVTVTMVLAGLVFAYLAYRLSPTIKKINYLIDDFSGTVERPGVPPRPGVMERLEGIEHALSSLDEILSGRSPVLVQMNSRLDRVESRVKRLEGRRNEGQH